MLSKLKFTTTTASILYLLLPIDIFFLTWLRWYYGIPAFLLLSQAAFSFLSKMEEHEENQDFFSKENITISIVLIAFLLLTGHGMFLSGSGYDTPWRNAVYYDLIYQSWPVIYDYSSSALIYYLTYWIVPAGICSIIGCSKYIANCVLFIWSFIGLRLFVSLLVSYLRIQKKQYIPVLLIFLLWSGLNSIGMSIEFFADLRPFYIDAEWGWHSWQFTAFTENDYVGNYMIRTTFDSIANIYHQFIPMLLCTALFLKYRFPYSILFFTFLLIPFSPFGAIGLCILSIFQITKQIVKTNQAILPLCKDVFSTSNLLAGLSIIPVFFFYFTANNAFENTSSILSAPLTEYTPLRITILLLYYLLYFIIFLDLCRHHIGDRWLYWSVLISLLIFPFFKTGRATDFCWNASMPAFFIVMIFVMQTVLLLKTDTHRRKQFWIMILIIGIAFTTPCTQIASQFLKCYRAGTHFVFVDSPGIGNTFSNKPKDGIESNLSDLRNFENPNYRERPFYIYLAKNN